MANRISSLRKVGWWLALVFCAGGMAWGVSSASGGTTYIVKKNDTITLIARQYGLTPAELARHNGMTLKSTIRTGQRLEIPGSSDTAPALAAAPGLAPSVASAIAQANVRKGRWKYVIIHHSGTSYATVRGMDEYHRNTRHMENGLAYHFVIGNGQGMRDGEVVVGARWTQQLDGGHLASSSLNAVSIGICLTGHFDQSRPTSQQVESLRALVQALRKRCHLKLSAVRTHQQINPVHTRCPGRLFDLKQALKGLR